MTAHDDDMIDAGKHYNQPTEPRMIDLTPTWEGIWRVYAEAYHSDTYKARHSAEIELARMARLADAYAADHPKVDQYQCLEWVADRQRWQFIAHGAAYMRPEAQALVERHAEKGIKVRLLPILTP